ncbi:MAG: ribonuclease D [Lysobacterales bacterium]
MTEWIADQAGLESVIAQIGSAEQHALDTEFERIRTYWPKLALLQVALPGRIALIDPLAFTDLSALAAALHNGGHWLMHSASEDLVALRPLSEKTCTALFDTQIAAALLGLGAALSYQKLVALVLGVDLAKSETRSDWMRRPLSPDQIEYAADDVIHLQALAEHLGDRLQRLGRIDWLWQDGARQIAASGDDIWPSNPQHEIRTASRLPLEVQLRAHALLHWRERTAREIDRPRNWVLDNNSALALALDPPDAGPALLARLKECRAFPRRLTTEVLALLADPQAEPGFAAAPAPLDREAEAALHRLRERVGALAQELALEPSTLASRRLLEGRVRDRQWPADCTAWRRELLEPLAREVLG